VAIAYHGGFDTPFNAMPTDHPNARLSRYRQRLLWAGFLTATLTACGGSASIGGGFEPPPPVSIATPGVAAVKLRTSAAGWTAMTEKLRPLANVAMPDRRLVIKREGSTSSAAYAAPDGWSLIDFAMHPSQDMTVVLATNTAIRLVRLDSQGRVLKQTDFADPLAATDPFVGDVLVIRNSQSLVPFATRDAARVAAIGEDAALVLRTGRNAVVAYRLGYSATAGFITQWRRIVEPGVTIGGIGLTSGTFDPFGGLDNQWRVTMDVNAEGQIAVAVAIGLTEIVDGHSQHFNEPLDPAIGNGVLLTQIAPNGARMTTTVVDTVKKSEIHAIRWVGDTVALAGRVRSEIVPDGTGWDGYVTLVQPATRRVTAYRTVHVDRGEVIFDIAPLSGGRLLVGGSAGYIQNPSGGSISEEATPLLAVLDAQGRLIRRVPFAAGPRHNQIRSIAGWKGNLLIAGFDNGPGTHSADSNPALLTADGFLEEVPVP
jgi:AraC-like DNA-binding protein